MREKYKDVGDPVVKVIEECSELIKIICKAERFGWDNWHPDDPTKTTNRELAKREMDDVVEAFEELEKHLRQLTYLETTTIDQGG